MDIFNYLESKGLEPQKLGEWIYSGCPVCGKHKLALNVNTHTGGCFVCKAENPDSWTVKTHINVVMKYFDDILEIAPIKSVARIKEDKDVDYTDLVERYHNALMSNNKALKYLYKRNLSEESIKRFKLGFAEFKNQTWICIPSFKDGIPQLLKYRKLPPDTNPECKKYEREPGGKSVLFNGDCMNECDEVIIVEGEIDCISLIQAGYENVVSTTLGAGGLPSDWYDDLLLMSKIYLCFDQDSAGQNGAKNVYARRLGIGRCYNILIPEGMDANEYFMSHTKEDFDKLIKNSERFSIEHISSMDDAFDEMYKKSQDNNDSVYPLPWGNVNSIIGGGLERSQLLVIGAQASIGKTSMAVQIAHYFAKEYNMPTLVFCLEMPVDQLLTKVILNDLDISYKEFNNSDAYIYKMSVGNLPIYFGYSSNITPEKYYNTVREARNRFGCGLFIFDNLQLMVISDNESDYAKAARMFKNMTMDLNIMNILIVQPRKINEEGRIMNYNDLFGSSSLSQAPDKIILIHRNRLTGEGEDAFSERALIINEKARFSTGGRRFLKYIGEKSKFVEYEKGEDTGE